MMEERNTQKNSSMARFFDIFLVVLGQVSVVLPFFCSEELTGYFYISAVVLSATGLGIRAKKSGRSTVAWVLVGCFVPLIVPIIGMVFMVFRERKGSPERKPFPPWGHGVVAAILFLVGAPLMDSFSFAFFSTIAAVIWVLAGRRGLYTKKQRFVLVMVYIAAFAMVVGAKTVNNRLSERNAAVIITACNAYLTKNGTYPESLNDLVPAYLPKVPIARYALISGGFWYRRNRLESGNQYSLMYTVEAPFARRVYHSERKTWHSID